MQNSAAQCIKCVGPYCWVFGSALSRSISILIVCLRIGPTVLSEIAKLMISSCHVLVSFEDKAEHPGPYSESALSFHVVKFIMSYYFQIIAVLGEFAGTTKFSRCIKNG